MDTPTLDLSTLYEAFGVYDTRGPKWPTERRRVRSRRFEEGEQFCPAEVTHGVSAVRLEFAAGESAPMSTVTVYGDDITGAFVRVFGCDERAVNRAYDRLLERMPAILEQVEEVYGS